MSIPAEVPTNENRRLRTLQSFEVLDSPAEQAYDDIVQLASYICKTPIALVSLVDEDRQWFKAKVGLSAAETPRGHAFCAHAIHDPQHVMQVANATEDARFAQNPLVTGDPNIRFYAGAPLVTPDGDALGTLCVIDREPRTLTAAQSGALQILARMVMNQLHVRHQLSAVELENTALKTAMRRPA